MNKRERKFIFQAINVHSNKYSYEKVKYVNTHTKVIIICHTHGAFEQSPNNHLHGNGCPQCSQERRISKLTGSKEDFVRKAIKIHHNYYNYSKVKYINTKTPVNIICPKHGNFKQPPKEHLQGYGCILCGRERTIAAHQRDTAWFITQARKVHGNFYDYSKVQYKKSIEPVIIICPTHGDFKQQPNHHLNVNCGCPRCIMSTGERKIMAVLNDMKIDYIYEYQIPQENKMPLRFDFYLPEINMAIEYDGEQHFFPVRFNGISTELANNIYQKTIQNDNTKNNYAQINNIKLIRIPYTKIHNVTNILNLEIFGYNST